MTFFNRVACFTDIHFGNKNNSKTHNKDCAEFVDWFVQQQKPTIETCISWGLASSEPVLMLALLIIALTMYAN